MSDLRKDVDNLLREVVGDYKNDKDSKKNLNEESDEQELLTETEKKYREHWEL